jgi:hypothetical protein
MADECVFWKDGKCTTEKARGTACDGGRTKTNFWSGKIPPECPYPIEMKKGTRKSHCVFWKNGTCDSDMKKGIECDGRATPEGCPYPMRNDRFKSGRGRGRPRLTITDCPHTDRMVQSHGMCRSCRQKHRYNTDPIFREKMKSKNVVAERKWMKKKEMEEPGYNAMRQRRYRKEHPENYMMAVIKCYIPHLSDENKKKIMDMIQKGDMDGQKKD